MDAPVPTAMRRRNVAAPDPPPRKAPTGDFVSNFKSLDVYPKTLSEFKEKTSSGGLISVVAVSTIFLLVVSQLAAYFRTHTVDHLSVDSERERAIRINLNISFPALPCKGIGLVTMDVAGEQQIDVIHNMAKTSLDPDSGRPLGAPSVTEVVNLRTLGLMREDRPDCGKCYTNELLQQQFVSTVTREVEDIKLRGQALKPGFGATCCNTCDDVRAAYQRVRLVTQEGGRAEVPDWKTHPLCAHDAELIDPGALETMREGCNVVGHLMVNKVAGNIHVAPGRAFASQQGNLVHEFKPFTMAHFNTSHTIHQLSFGPHYPSQLNPLDGVTKRTAGGSALYQYYIKVVPTTYKPLRGEPLVTSQYSVTEAERPVAEGTGARGAEFVLPGVFFIYDISPVKVTYTVTRQPLSAFLTSLAAIVGGVFVVAGMIDAAVYNMDKVAHKKDGGQLGL